MFSVECSVLNIDTAPSVHFLVSVFVLALCLSLKYYQVCSYYCCIPGIIVGLYHSVSIIRMYAYWRFAVCCPFHELAGIIYMPQAFAACFVFVSYETEEGFTVP